MLISGAVAMIATADDRTPASTTGQRHRHLDPRQQLDLAHAHPAAGLLEVGIHAPQAGVGVGDDRWDAQRDQRDQARQEAVTGALQAGRW